MKQSFLKEYPVEVLHNQIDKSLFKPTPSGFRKQYGLDGKTVVLGAASVWTREKGLPDFCRLREKLDSRYAIVLVGVTEKQKSGLPAGILALPRTADAEELAGIYSAADVFVNPTHQDTYPTVNLEARACGTPVVTYDVGGSPESAGGEHIAAEGDIDGLAEENPPLTTTCRKHFWDHCSREHGNWKSYFLRVDRHSGHPGSFRRPEAHDGRTRK